MGIRCKIREVLSALRVGQALPFRQIRCGQRGGHRISFLEDPVALGHFTIIRELFQEKLFWFSRYYRKERNYGSEELCQKLLHSGRPE